MGAVASESEGTAVETKVPQLEYERYICIPKSVASTLLTTLDKLSKMAASLSAKNVVIRTLGKDRVLFTYDNTFYKFEFELPNVTQREMDVFCISIDHLKKFFGIATSYLTFVEQFSGDGTPVYYVMVGSNPVFVEQQQFESALYDIAWPEFTEQLSGEYLAKGLPQFTSLLSLAERPSEKQLISSGASSYINIGSIFGKARSFFGEGHDCIVGRLLVDCIGILSSFDGSDVKASFSDRSMAISFGTSARLLFAYTTGAVVGRFMSPAFKDSFNYSDSVSIDSSEFSSLLSLVSSLDYFADMVTVQFTPTQLQLTVHQKDGVDQTYSFAYTGGSTDGGTLVVPLSVLLGVMANAPTDAKYSCSGSSMVIDAGDFVYCVRSVMS